MARPNIGQLIPLFKSGLPPSPYTRPVDWLTLPEVSEGDQKVVGLHAVFPHDSNFVALQVSGAYTVDWGDGVVENYSGGASAYHKFDYNDLGAETECVRGYRQAIVTIIPTPGQKLTSVNFSIKHNQSGLPNGYSTGWLDVKAAGSEINTFRFETFTVVQNAMLEIFEFVGSNKITTNFSYMFYGCCSLQSIPQLNTSSGTNFSYMFGIVAYGLDYCCHSLSAGALSGTSYDISYENCRLSRQALVDIFNGLATVSGATINIMGNWGIEDLTTEDRNIATNKGWIIKE